MFEGIISEEFLLFFVAIPIFLVILVYAILKISYTVVPPHKAHVIVSRGKGRKIYMARENYKTSYWRIPLIQQRSIVPLENVQLGVKDIYLRDSNMAKFDGDVVAWLNICDPLLAAERVGDISKDPLQQITADILNVIRAVTRNKSMYWSIVDIMKKRKHFSNDVEKAVNDELKEWGMRVIELEVIHFTDIEGYTVIHDLEARQAKVINAETRKQIAGQEKEASSVVRDIEAKIETIAAKTANLKGADKPKVLYLYEPIWVAGSGTLANSYIEKARGINVAADIQGCQSMDLEQVIARNPDVILCVEGYAFTMDWVINEQRLEGVTAVKNNRVYPLDADTVDCPGPRVGTALEQVAKCLHPELFGARADD